ncbi:MAG: hypothetical protein ACKODT_07035 [Fluviibacter sp.]
MSSSIYFHHAKIVRVSEHEQRFAVTFDSHSVVNPVIPTGNATVFFDSYRDMVAAADKMLAAAAAAGIYAPLADWERELLGLDLD